MSSFERFNQSGQQRGFTFREFQFHNWVRHLALFRFACFILSLMIFLTSFFGLREIVGGGGWHSVIVPLVTAVGGGVLFGAAWHKLFGTLPLMESPHRRMQLIVIALVIAALQTLFSAWPVATTISGSSAITQHLSHHLGEARAAFQRAYHGVAGQSGMIGEVETAAAENRAHAELEIKAGAASGRAGDGVVAKAFDAASKNLSGMADQMRAAFNKAAGDNENGMDILRQMDGLAADSSIPSAERQRQYADLTSRLGNVVQALNTTDLTAPLNGLIGGIVYRTGKTTNSNQVSALNDVTRTVQRIGDEIKARAKAMRKNVVVEVPAFMPLSTGMAVITYAQELPMGWGIALGLDLLPFLLLMALLICVLDNRTEERPSPSLEPSAPLHPSPPISAEAMPTVSGSGNGKKPTLVPTGPYSYRIE